MAPVASEMVMTPAPRVAERTAPTAASWTRSARWARALASARRGGPAAPFAASPFPREWQYEEDEELSHLRAQHLPEIPRRSPELVEVRGRVHRPPHRPRPVDQLPEHLGAQV